MPPLPSLDHLILFTPAPALPPAFTPFTPTPGGTHADNLTANTLILLADGCYIELIHFLPTAPSPAVATHWWGPHRPATPAWKDWCLTTRESAAANHASVSASHAAPVAGARLRADGVSVQWAVTFPRGALGGQVDRGRVPFFCHDVTPRGLRVPLGVHAMAHECGALGVAGLSVVVRDQGLWEETRAVYERVLGAGREEKDGVVFEVGRVEEVSGVAGGARVLLRVATEAEGGALGEGGFAVRDVVLFALAGEGRERGGRVRLDGEGEGVGGLWVEYV